MENRYGFITLDDMDNNKKIYDLTKMFDKFFKEVTLCKKFQIQKQN